MEIHQMDIKTAFVNGDLEEEIYMEQPEGFTHEGEHLVCKLHKSVWLETISKGLEPKARRFFEKHRVYEK
jgi:hypothetical protein